MRAHTHTHTDEQARRLHDGGSPPDAAKTAGGDEATEATKTTTTTTTTTATKTTPSAEAHDPARGRRKQADHQHQAEDSRVESIMVSAEIYFVRGRARLLKWLAGSRRARRWSCARIFHEERDESF